MVKTLSSPGVSIGVQDDSIYAENFPSSTPLFVLATRSNKQRSDGTGIAAGTAESNTLRLVSSQREVLQLLGNPTFVTSAGVAVPGHETNEYGLHAMWSFMQTSSRAYYIRADVDLGELVATTTEPTGAPNDGTYWIDKDAAVGGIYRRNNANTAWEAVTTHFVTTAPDGDLGADGDWAFDYSTTDGTIKFRADDDSWNAVGSADLTSTTVNGRTATNNKLWVSDAAPTGAGADDYWWKTSSAGAGFDLKLTKYRASDNTWVAQTITRSATEPTLKTAGLIWEDISTLAADGQRPLKVANGTSYSAMTHVVQDGAPSTAPATGTLWYEGTYDDFAMYVEDTNAWAEVATTTNSNPTNRQKVISASAPTSPATGAIWIDTTISNLDVYPVVKRYNGTAWEDITSSITISDTYTAASLVEDGTYWINTADPSTTYVVKEYDPTYEPPVVNSGGDGVDSWTSAHGRWKVKSGTNFGRRAVRSVVVTALQAAIADNDEIRSEAYYYQLMATPGYPELFDEMVSLNTDINEEAFIIADVPARMVPSGVPTSPEVTVTEWKSNANGAITTGEDGFTASGYAYAAMYYPWGLSTNVDGLNVVVPASTIALRTIAYNDSVAYPWFAPMGNSRGLVNNASSVGRITYEDKYKVQNLTRGQMDSLYDNRVNPILFKVNTGLRVWGQRTTYGTNTSLDDVAVARLIVKMRYDLRRSLEGFIGRPADPITWRSASNLVEKYLSGLQSQRALTDFAVRVNEENNTADRIARNEMWVDMAILPIRAVEFVYVPIRIVADATDIR